MFALAVLGAAAIPRKRWLLAAPAALRLLFDLVVIDTPPMLQMADARVIARAADAVILVIRSQKTMRDAALLAAKRFTEDGTRILGTILITGIPASPARTGITNTTTTTRSITESKPGVSGLRPANQVSLCRSPRRQDSPRSCHNIECGARLVKDGQMIAEYPEDSPLPSCLLLGFPAARALHVVAALDRETRICYVVTAYPPDPNRWRADFNTRRGS